MPKKRAADPYRIIPPATAKERTELRKSIEAVGLRSPVIIDEKNNIIDGHERRDICEELGIDWLAGADVRIGLSDVEKRALAIDINLWRRNVVMTQAKRKELLDIYLIANPDLSETLVADLFGVSQATVNRRKRQLIQMHKLKRPMKTVGKDGVVRSVGKRKKQPARLVVKSKREYDSILPDLAEVAGDLSGIVRRPGTIKSQVRRKKALASVKECSAMKLPSTIDIRHCDLRNLTIQRGTLDLILTDPPWSLDYLDDWNELGKLAKMWLKPSGMLASYIGNNTLPHFCSAFMPHLTYRKTIAVQFDRPKRAFTGEIECWRPIVIFSKQATCRIEIADLLKSPKAEKDYHDWQQSLSVVQELVEKLSKAKAVICDPFIGTGTTAVAVDLAGKGRRFIGCDVEEERTKIAKHRVAIEGRRSAG